MIKHKDHFHGSDLEKIEEIYGIKKEEIVSFSANVNPLGVSPLLKHTLSDQIDAITSYPDREYTSLRRCIAAYCGTETENVIVGNGSTELISLLFRSSIRKRPLSLVLLTLSTNVKSRWAAAPHSIIRSGKPMTSSSMSRIFSRT